MWGAVALLLAAVAGFAALTYFYFSVPRNPPLNADTLCPIDGARGVVVVLVDTSDELPETTKREVLGILDDQITSLPPYYLLDIRVLDFQASRSRSLFAKCNPGDGAGLSEWTNNPRIARLQWIESFRRPARAAVENSIKDGKATSSPIMAAIQDAAIEQFSRAASRSIEKNLIVISDMVEYTNNYSQYPSAGDLSYDRFKRSPAYLKFRTDLHGSKVKIEYVQRLSPKIDTVKLFEFWQEWIVDNRGGFAGARRLQGAS